MTILLGLLYSVFRMDTPQTLEDRARMVREQLAGRGIRDERVLAAMGRVPRHLFVPPENRHLAYGDGPLPIGEGQTISQPFVVALMTELLGLRGGERVLEVGTGSGYQAAVLAELAGEVFSVEIQNMLAKRARQSLAEAGYAVRVFVGDGSGGLPEHAPYDAIILAAAAPRVPRRLADQLVERGGQQLELYVRGRAGFRRRKVIPVAFVPLRGRLGWSEEEWGD
jgi:protein-L-isoaspartate(D-aspartate) O-methyltransferase